MFSLNAVVPVFVVVFLGWALKKKNIITDSFVNSATTLVFKLALPVLLFKQVYSADLSNIVSPGFALFAAGAIVGNFLFWFLVIPLFIKDNRQRGAMIHTIYRSNFSILGLPLIFNMFGEENCGSIIIVLPITVILFNILAVFVLSYFDKTGEGQRTSPLAVLKGIVTNPLIIACVLGVLYKLFALPMPTMLSTSINYLANLATPVALISIGGQFDFRSAMGNLKLSLTATFLKIVVAPVAIIAIGALCGFRGVELGTLFILFASPTAVSSYIMAKNMNSDAELTGQITLLTTFFSAFSIFAIAAVLRALALI